MAHEGMTGGHLGRTKTEGQVQLRAYWPSWTSDVRNVVRKCQNCARYHRGKPPRQAALRPFVAGEAFELISIDVTGPHPVSKKGNRFIVTVVDSFSKWAEAFPVRNHNAETIARLLVDRVFATFGIPKQILSDRGPEFESTLFAALCKLMRIDKIRTTAYKASTNGLVERFHSTLNSMIAKVVSEDQYDWDVHLPTILAAYRASRHESTGFSPNFIVFGKENRAPIDLVIPSPPTYDDSSVAGVDEYTERVRERYTRAYDIVRENLSEAAQRRKEYYDTRVKTVEFKVDDLVWYFYPKRKKGRSPKWTSFYTGPYRIVRVIPPCNFVLKKGPRSKPFVAHADKLKRCYSESLEHQPFVDSRAQPSKASRTHRATANELADIPDTDAHYRNQQSDEQEYDSDTQPRRGARNRRPPRPYSPE
jgi:transposase InsO family protein